ncbi:MAG: hypothetical protein AB1428_13350 [Bacteroidota bacterium]
MRTTSLMSAALAFLIGGCATFKELEPKPELSPLERGYIELKNDEENFRLDKDKHYFIRFPRPARDNFALVLRINAKPALSSYLTRQFDDGKEPIVRITDEAGPRDSLSVYPIDMSAPVYYWVIDTVRQDLDLEMTYRYVPRWRFTFETKYAGLKATLAGNVADRSVYNGAPGAASIDAVDFASELDAVESRTARLSAMNEQLKAVAGLFPPDIAAARDTAYLNYTALRSAVEDELQFQKNYATSLGVFQKEKSTWGNTGAFLREAGTFAEFLSQRDRYPSHIIDKARKAFSSRLTDAVPFYERQLQRKRDSKPFAPSPSLEPVAALFTAMGRTPSDFEALRAFVQQFNLEADGLQNALDRLKEMNASIDRAATPPPATFYANMSAAARDVRTRIPQPQAVTHERYRGLEAAGILALDLGKATELADDLLALFTAGERIATDITDRAWGFAEAKTRDLYEGREGRTFVSAARQRDKFVRWFEADIFAGVKRATLERLDAFVKINESSFDDVARLYADSAFLPVHELSFSSGGPVELARRKAQIDEYITRVRNYQFPEAAIRAIYKDFTRDMNALGVERARAIVEHGKLYKGADKQIAAIILECDPNAAKWIVRPKEYRRILALPVTSNRKGVNEYIFRLRLQIPSEAQFPVFDVNIKLPKELAESAGHEQWYDQITINKNPIKNEGRFRITSPTADNNYESQITPVQMDKEGTNILEVRFKKNSYKVYEVSAMAQVPIMKKN